MSSADLLPGLSPGPSATEEYPWPLASVIVPSHAGAQRLPVLLEALDRQDVTAPWEVVVVVDGIVDETPDLLAEYVKRLPLRSLVVEETQGLVAALNAGYGAARGEILIRVDDDLTPEEGFVQRHVAWHEGREDLAVIGLARDLYPYTPFARAYGLYEDHVRRMRAYAADEDSVWTLWGANTSLHRLAWARVGGFDPDLPVGHDAELAWRLREAGVRFLVDPELETERRRPRATAGARVTSAFCEGAARRYVERAHPQARWPQLAEPASGLRTATVRFVARRLRTRDRFERVAGALDRTLPRLPRGLGYRSVQLLEQSARRAGHVSAR